jgi:hypothetical protein
MHATVDAKVTAMLEQAGRELRVVRRSGWYF